MSFKFIILDPRSPRRFWRLSAYFYILGILFFSTRPDLRPPGSENIAIDQIKNWLHVPAYAGLTFLLLCGLGRLTLKSRILAFTLALGYGGLNELFQLTVPGRSSSWEDVGRNAAGAALAVLLVRKNPILYTLAVLKKFQKYKV